MNHGKRSLFANPESLLALFISASVALWTLPRSFMQSVLSIDIYETIVWGSQMQWGHSKHPPLSGWIGYFASWVTGHSDWGMYLIAQLCIGAGVFFSFKLARLFFDRYRAVMAALMLYLLFFYTPSTMQFSTYFVEIAVAPMSAYALLKALRDDKIWRWMLFGVSCALGILNKYSFGLIMVGFALFVLSKREYRRSLVTLGPYVAALVFLFVISPHLKWLWDHDFVCFRHVGGRLDETPSPRITLMAAEMTVYPLVVEFLALVLSAFPVGSKRGGRTGGFFTRIAVYFRRIFASPRGEREREALHFSLILTLLPGVFYIIMSLCGKDIILMWLCSVFSASGIMILALFPIRIDGRALKRFAVLLALYIAVSFACSSWYSLFHTATSMHLDHDDAVRQVDRFWKAHTAEPIMVVVGGLRYAALYSHYSAGHPPVCEPDDDIMIELYRERIRRHGALLIDRDEADFSEFLKRAKVKVRFTTLQIDCRSKLGKPRKNRFVVGYLPPGSDL